MRVLVTGGSRGIGAAIVRALANRGDAVVASGRDPDALAEVARCGALTEPFDFRAEGPASLCASAEALLGGLDGLVYAAGVARYEGIGAITQEALRLQLAVNLEAPLLLAQAAAPALRQSRGSIVFVTSTLAERPAPMTAAYAASKAALTSVTRTLALELAPEVRVNAVAPGVVDTAMVRQLRLAPGEAPPEDPTPRVEAQLEALAALHPLGRLGTAEEVAREVLHLLDATWTTGSIQTVDGGVSLR